MVRSFDGLWNWARLCQCHPALYAVNPLLGANVTGRANSPILTPWGSQPTSRWLSEAPPPVNRKQSVSHPEGMPAPTRCDPSGRREDTNRTFCDRSQWMGGCHDSSRSVAHSIGVTVRLLNFFWQASRAWKLEFDGNSKMVNSRLVLAVLSKASEGA